MLYIVSTPIGNLGDISFRALEILKSVDYIACEDTRKTSILLKKYEVQSNLISYHAHSTFSKTNKILELLKDGKDIALVSDAGTPGVSDPGIQLIREVKKEGLDVSAIPGASAFLCALTMTGLSNKEFTYLGFIPHKKGRKKIMEKMDSIDHVVIFYESSHRICKCLRELDERLTVDRDIYLCKELTKIYENCTLIKRADLASFADSYSPKGEYVVVLSPPL